MWYKYLITGLFFYFFSLLQNSFFAHLNLWGAVPNLVFIFFVLLTFFTQKKDYYFIIFCAFVAGLLIDIFSSSYIGTSVLLLIVIGLGIKKIQGDLFEGGRKPMTFYFLGLFFIAFLVYSFLIYLYYYFLGPKEAFFVFDSKLFFEIIYNLVFAFLFFLIYKRFCVNAFDNRQLNLFKK